MAHLTDQQREEIIKKLSEMDSYFQTIQTAIAPKKTYEDSGYNIDEVLKKLEDYKFSVNKILTSPPPASTKSSEKKAEGKKEGDVEMKDESNAGSGTGTGGDANMN